MEKSIARINLKSKATEEALLYVLKKNRLIKSGHRRPSEYLALGFVELHVKYYTGCIKCGDKGFAWFKYDLISKKLI